MSWAETLFLSKIIKGQKSYAASDNELVMLLATGFTPEKNVTTKIPNVSFKPLTNGTLRVKSNISLSAAYNSPVSCTLYIYKDGQQYLSGGVNLNQPTATGGYINETKTIFIDCPMEKNSKYEFYVLINASGNGQGSARITNLYLCGHVVDLSMLEYTR